MRLDRRLLARAAAALFTSLGVPNSRASTDGFKGIAVVAGGFLIDASKQYHSYAQALSKEGCATILFKDESTLSMARPLAVVCAVA